MINILRELPDWAFGTALAGTGWLAVCYGVLADRALDDHLQSDLAPACFATLKADQDETLVAAEERLRAKARRERRQLRKKIEHKRAELRELEIQHALYQTLKQQYERSNLSEIIPIPLPEMVSPAELENLRAIIARAEKILKEPVTVTLPRMADEEIRTQCLCAAIARLGDAKAQQALSLASFRLVPITQVTAAKTALANAVQINACSPLPWREL
ncbi:MAG: hypothetical protein AAGD92_16005 [Pseudomonadota bacterium]